MYISHKSLALHVIFAANYSMRILWSPRELFYIEQNYFSSSSSIAIAVEVEPPHPLLTFLLICLHSEVTNCLSQPRHVVMIGVEHWYPRADLLCQAMAQPTAPGSQEVQVQQRK